MHNMDAEEHNNDHLEASENRTNQTSSTPDEIIDDAALKQPENDNQMADWQQWCPGAKVGEIVQTPLNPLLC